MDLSKLAFSVGKYAGGVNWWMLLFKAAVVIGLAISLYACGSHNATVKCEQAKVVAAEKKSGEIIRYVEKRIPVIQKETEEVIKWKTKVVHTGDKLNESIQAQPDRPACGLSADELRFFNEQAQATL